jgi:hypothetical protein
MPPAKVRESLGDGPIPRALPWDAIVLTVGVASVKEALEEVR